MSSFASYQTAKIRILGKKGTLGKSQNWLGQTEHLVLILTRKSQC